MQPPIANWNPARGVWETTTKALYCEHSELYSATWPTSGSMRNGSVFPHPTSAPRTKGKGASSQPGRLLKTPTSNLGANGGAQHPDKRKAGGHGPTLKDEVQFLLPTPDATHGRETTRTSLLLPGVVKTLSGAATPPPSDDGSP